MRQPEATESMEADGVRALSVGDFMTRELVTLK